MEITEEKKNLNFTMWIKKLKDYGCYSESMMTEMGEKIRNSTFNINEQNGACYDGALIDTVLFNLCTLAFHVNDLAFGGEKAKHPFLNVNINMLMRVLLLQHIAKAEFFVPQTEPWKKNKGYLYDFANNMETQLKLGERSAFLCLKYGIHLSEAEYEAMTIIDKEDKTFNSHQNPLAVLVKMINQLVQVELQRKCDYYSKNS